MQKFLTIILCLLCVVVVILSGFHFFYNTSPDLSNNQTSHAVPHYNLVFAQSNLTDQQLGSGGFFTIHNHILSINSGKSDTYGITYGIYLFNYRNFEELDYNDVDGQVFDPFVLSTVSIDTNDTSPDGYSARNDQWQIPVDTNSWFIPVQVLQLQYFLNLYSKCDAAYIQKGSTKVYLPNLVGSEGQCYNDFIGWIPANATLPSYYASPNPINPF